NTCPDNLKLDLDRYNPAKEYYPGEKEIRDVAYDLGFISDKDISPEFYNTAIRLQVGEVSHPVKTEWGYHLIKLVERRSDSPVVLYKDKIKTLVSQEKQKKVKAEWEKSLREDEEIWVNEKSVKKFKLKPEKAKGWSLKAKGTQGWSLSPPYVCAGIGIPASVLKTVE
ncbi:MAG: peptidylprolyl isomerase, partial [candidate division Zixibacteria bacterium]|nr:peptidylprolyl isomerase [candidate division Zixibacteria bacterium]